MEEYSNGVGGVKNFFYLCDTAGRVKKAARESTILPQYSTGTLSFGLKYKKLPEYPFIFPPAYCLLLSGLVLHMLG